MTDPARYRTIAAPAEAEIEAKRSRFRCRLARVTDEAGARAVVEEARRTHWDARHHCSAFILQPDGMVQRSSDDGEPSGTAGMPMLEVLRGAGLTEVAAVVTRWFGGTLLGTGGLVRAYSEAVSAAVAGAARLERELMTEYVLRVPLADAGPTEQALRQRGYAVLDTRWGEETEFLLGVSAAAVAGLAEVCAQLTGGVRAPERRAERWVDIPGS